MGTPYESSFRSLCESGLDADEAGAADFSVSPLFLLFLQEIISERSLLRAENLERGRRGEPENSENPTAAHRQSRILRAIRLGSPHANTILIENMSTKLRVRQDNGRTD
jgi:hypothetical protein